MNEEIALRKEAIRRYIAGESQSSISRRLVRSRRWVSQWIHRYDPDDPEGSLSDRSRAPKRPHRKWSVEVIQQALHERKVREEAEESGARCLLVGAVAIAYELRALKIDPAPPARTVHYWLKQADQIKPRSFVPSMTSEPKSYPTPLCEHVNDLQELDLKGPFYLQNSSQKHYLLALRDCYSKGVALEANQDRQSHTMVRFLVQAWQRRGIPKVLQMDNGLEFRGSNRYPRSFGKVVHLCLQLDVEPLFIPPREPWRNGVIENFNGLADRLLLKRQDFANSEQLQLGVRELEQSVNSAHRLSALDGLTPDEFLAQQSIRLLPTEFEYQKRDLHLLKGYVSFIRKVRKSGRITLCANDKFEIDPNLQNQYVLARVNVQEQSLNIYFQGKLIKTFEYAM